MKLGIIVEGESEYHALPMLLRKVRSDCGFSSVRVTRAAVTPLAPLRAIVRQCHSRVMEHIERGSDRILLLLDRENQVACCGEIARLIREAVRGHSSIEIGVVIKDKTFENWVIADVDALASQPARFDVTDAVRNKIEPNKADSVDARELLRAAVRGPSYSKVLDAKRTLLLADPDRLGSNSRSFRRLLRCMGYPTYAGQSRSPV